MQKLGLLLTKETTGLEYGNSSPGACNVNKGHKILQCGGTIETIFLICKDRLPLSPSHIETPAQGHRLVP